MASMDEIMKKTQPVESETIEIDGMCEECFYPFEWARYYPKTKTLECHCVNDHVIKVAMDLGNG